MRAQWSTVPAAPPIRLPIPNPNPNPEFQFQDFRTREIACHLICQFFAVSLFHSLHFNGHLPGGPGLACTRMSPFCIFLERRVMEMVSTTAAIRRAKLQSKCHHQQTNTQFFLQAGCLSCPPTNSAKALKEKVSAVYCFYNLKP